jgi:hypothetical protein
VSKGPKRTATAHSWQTSASPLAESLEAEKIDLRRQKEDLDRERLKLEAMSERVGSDLAKLGYSVLQGSIDRIAQGSSPISLRTFTSPTLARRAAAAPAVHPPRAAEQRGKGEERSLLSDFLSDAGVAPALAPEPQPQARPAKGPALSGPGRGVASVAVAVTDEISPSTLDAMR